ncbi:hypothetical protein [Lentzea guizhouensis]|uniref:hypothetical protein n=1 Tax=Lentzea guizhouensis TaxID=1586287 RepID=UPI0015D1ABAD|nr:hypothetical protein [Lentzea guizhouensis]
MSLRRFVVAVVLSGLPSTLHALATGRDPLQATKAAASLVPVAKRGSESSTLVGTLVRGAVVHVGVSAWWAFVLARLQVRGVVGGAVAGLLIAALDLEVIGRRCPEVRALPRVPQWLDHVAFGVLVAEAHVGRPPRRSHQVAVSGMPTAVAGQSSYRAVSRGSRRSMPASSSKSSCQSRRISG